MHRILRCVRVVIHSLGTLQDSGIGGQSVLFPAESLEIFMLRVLTSIRLQFETATSRMLKASNDDHTVYNYIHP